MTSSTFDDQARAYLAALPVLEEVEDMGRAVLFVGRRPDGSRVLAEVPRPLGLTRSLYMLPDIVQPAELIIRLGTRAAPLGYFLFAVFEDTPQGAALRTKLEELALTSSPAAVDL